MNGSAISEELKEDLFPSEDYYPGTVPPGRSVLDKIFSDYKSFSRAVSDLKVIIDEFVSVLGNVASSTTEPSSPLFLNESMSLVHARWSHIAKSFQKSYGGVRSASASPRSRWKSVEGGRTQSGALFSSIQISLIGEIHDNSQYDFRHNFYQLHSCDKKLSSLLERIRSLSNLLAHVVTPCEHGLSLVDRTYIGATFLRPLIQKFRFDCRLSTGYPLGDESVYLNKHNESLSSSCRVRLYFAHHSHLISLINLVRSLDAKSYLVSSDLATLDSIGLLGYLSRVIIRIYKTFEGQFKVIFSISKGDDFSRREPTSFPSVDVVETIFPNREALDNFFTHWLSLATLPESTLGPIGESTSENLE